MMLTENHVIEAVANHLATRGWTINQKLTTAERGIDIIASRAGSGRLLVEAKGGTSSMRHTKRFGKPFDDGQVKKHVSVAFYYAAKLQGLHPADSIALALPDDAWHRAAIEAIGAALGKLVICVYFVAADGGVCEWSGHGLLVGPKRPGDSDCSRP
ncbi:hypothetical protein [Stigmatella erecta]|uniref:Uncharacterized protein n=1 Tax=Stigmatella erecta TaxID=83460 RepID=A0A1I0EJH5_9BACT|nr:hypothetical protein [Stigmatella erecta]SET45355.1 hypothetical protein SAMN05443639_1035 [Stigmatella erecta]